MQIFQAASEAETEDSHALVSKLRLFGFPRTCVETEAVWLSMELKLFIFSVLPEK